MLEERFNLFQENFKNPHVNEDIDNSSTWKIPTHILAFLENVLTDITLSTSVVSWKDFKDTIFNILKHRINNSQELLGGVNTTYTPLCEYLIIYFIDKHKTR